MSSFIVALSRECLLAEAGPRAETNTPEGTPPSSPLQAAGLLCQAGRCWAPLAALGDQHPGFSGVLEQETGRSLGFLPNLCCQSLAFSCRVATDPLLPLFASSLTRQRACLLSALPSGLQEPSGRWGPAVDLRGTWLLCARLAA